MKVYVLTVDYRNFEDEESNYSTVIAVYTDINKAKEILAEKYKEEINFFEIEERRIINKELGLHTAEIETEDGQAFINIEEKEVE